jgi:glycosyltransferase involved in cell wall biosynthesis
MPLRRGKQMTPAGGGRASSDPGHVHTAPDPGDGPDPLRVALHVDQLWFPSPGGIGTYVWELVSALLADPRVAVRRFRTRWTHPPRTQWLTQGPGEVVVRLPPRVAYTTWAATRRPPLPASLAGAAIVHAPNPATIPPVRRGQALVVTVHDLAFEEEPQALPAAWRRLFERGLAIARDDAAAILVPSTFVAESLRARGTSDRVHVVPLSGRPVPTPAPTLPPPAVVERLGVATPYVLSVGTLEPRKNQARLVRAFVRATTGAALPHTLVLAGYPGWSTDELDAAIVAAPPGRVRRIESLGDHDLDALYRGAAATAYVSVTEGFGMPVLEAMARGAPVMASNAGAIPEVAGDAALLVDPRDEDAIADGLVLVLTDEAFAQDLRRHGLERAATFSWERTARETIAVYGQASPSS